jgi:hypothetical protein
VTLPDGVVPLVTGTVLALISLAFVLAPLWEPPTASREDTHPSGDARALADLVGRHRAIEFDRASGKLSEGSLFSPAPVMDDTTPSSSARPSATVSDDVVEAAIRCARARIRTCPTCGPRPEHDALFCSQCGRFLNAACGNCGTPVAFVDARFCSGCGEGLALTVPAAGDAL